MSSPLRDVIFRSEKHSGTHESRLIFLWRIGLFCAVAALICGCAASRVQGLRLYEEVLTTTNTRSKIVDALGSPRDQQEYQNSTKAGELPEWRAFPPVFFGFITSGTVLSGWAEFEVRGPVYNSGAAQAAGMISTMTLGVGEIWSQKEVSKHQKQEMNAVRVLRLWFTEDGKLAGHQMLKDSTREALVSFDEKMEVWNVVYWVEAYFGEQIKLTDEVKKLRSSMRISAKNLTRDQVAEMLKYQLREKHGVLIERGSDGWLVARLIK